MLLIEYRILPLNEESLNVMCEHVEQMQDALQRQILVENPSNYFVFDQLQIPEPEFLNTLAKRTGCQLLVDVNNIHVSAMNTGRDSQEYVAQLDTDLIGQYHLAGYTEVERDGEKVLIDTHNQVVHSPVWELFRRVVAKHGARPTLIEWDSDFPAFDVLLGECEKANSIIVESAKCEAKVSPHKVTTQVGSEVDGDERTVNSGFLRDQQLEFMSSVLAFDGTTSAAIAQHKTRIGIYQNNVFSATRDYLADVYPATKGVVGDAFFKQLCTKFIQESPPAEGNIHTYGAAMVEFVEHAGSLSKLPYLADLMRYEWALHAAYFSQLINRDEQTLTPHETSQDELLVVEVAFNSSVFVIHSQFPIWEIHRQSLPSYKEAVKINLNQSQDILLVYKHDYQIETKKLSLHEYSFLQKIQTSSNLMQAIEKAQSEVPPEALSKMLAFIFDAGLLVLRKEIN